MCEVDVAYSACKRCYQRVGDHQESNWRPCAAAAASACKNCPGLKPNIQAQADRHCDECLGPGPGARSWQEKAVGLYLRDFADEDASFQVKVVQQALADEHKAMTFVKMKFPLRAHWVAQLRDAHFRELRDLVFG